MSEKISLALEGLVKLRRASILMIIASIIGAAASIAVISMIFGMLAIHPAMPSPPSSIIGVVVAGVVIWLISAILQLIAVFAYLVPSFRKLKEYDTASFGTSSTLITIGYIGGTVLLIISIVVIFASLLARSLGGIMGGEMIIFVSIILLLIGYIGIIIGCFKLRDHFQETLFLAAGILFIVALVLSFIPYIRTVGGILEFIAWIILYVATGSAIRKLKTQQALLT